jgi:hypothetical protein
VLVRSVKEGGIGQGAGPGGDEAGVDRPGAPEVEAAGGGGPGCDEAKRRGGGAMAVSPEPAAAATAEPIGGYVGDVTCRVAERGAGGALGCTGVLLSGCAGGALGADGWRWR